MFKPAVLAPRSSSLSVYALFFTVDDACETNTSVISGVKNILIATIFSLTVLVVSSVCIVTQSVYSLGNIVLIISVIPSL